MRVVRFASEMMTRKLVHDVGLAYRLEKGTGEAVCNHLEITPREKLRDSGDPVADNVVQQFSPVSNLRTQCCLSPSKARA